MIPAILRRENIAAAAVATSSIAHGEPGFTRTGLSVLICAALLLAVSMCGRDIEAKPTWIKNCRMVLLVGIWYWTTTTWATETKQILAAFTADRGEPGFPLLGFWLTFAPQLASAAVCMLGMLWRCGASTRQELAGLQERGKNFWFLAGAAYWYGQFFTVQSLVFGSPVLTFIVKATEPLSTALLAVVVLRSALSPLLMLGIFVACVGIMVSVASANSAESTGSPFGSHGQMAGMAFALLGNLGFSSRSCVAKKAFSTLHADAFETYSMMTFAGTQAGILPILTYGLASHIGGGALWSLPFFDPRFSASSWLVMSLSYILYQTCSVLVLSSIAVESHALLVALKHLLVVVLVSILVHAHLSQGVLFGMALTLLGVYLYLNSMDRSAAKEDLAEKQPLQAVQGNLKKGAAEWQAPTFIRILVWGILLLGAVTPAAIAEYGLHSAADL